MTTLLDRFRRLKCLVITISAACVFAACGGGGGGGASTTPPAWGQQQVLSTGTAFNETSDAAIHASGEGLAVWVQETSLGSKVAARRYSSGVWQEGFTVISDNGTESAISSPQVAVLSSGEAIAAWEQTTTFAPNNKITRVMSARTVNQVWQAPIPIDTLPQNIDANSLDVVAVGGVGMAVWSPATPTPVVRSSAFRNNAFQPVETVNLGTSSAESPSLSMDVEGNALVAWIQTSQGVKRTFVSTSRDGFWQAHTELNPGAALAASLPSAATGVNGKAVVAWRQQINATTEALEISTTDNLLLGGWSAPQILAEKAGSKLTHVDATQDPRGTTTVVWTQRDDAVANPQGPVDLWAVRVGASVSPAQKVDAVSLGDSFQPLVDSDASGGAMAVWVQDVDSSGGFSSGILANRFDPVTGQWGQAEIISIGNNKSQSPSPALAMNTSGQALATWEQISIQGITSVVANVFK